MEKQQQQPMIMKTFITEPNPTQEQIEELDERVNDFCKNIIDSDNLVIKQANAHSVGNQNCVVVWYIELSKQEEDQTTNLGENAEEKKA